METDKSRLINILAYFLLTNLMIIVTVVLLHEVGHVFLGTLLGCSEAKILLEFPKIMVSTKLVCPAGVRGIVSMGSFLFTIPFSLSFLVFEKLPEKEFVWIALGLTVFTSAQDVVNLTQISFLFPVFIISGLVLVLYGEEASSRRLHQIRNKFK